MAEWFKAADCKFVVVSRRGFKSYSSHIINLSFNGKICRS